MTPSNRHLGAALAALLLLAHSGEARARQVKLTKTVDVSTKLFVLKKLSVEHPLGKLRIRGWTNKRVRMRAGSMPLMRGKVAIMN